MALTDLEYRQYKISHLMAEVIENEDKFLDGEKLDKQAIAEWAFGLLERQKNGIVDALDKAVS